MDCIDDAYPLILMLEIRPYSQNERDGLLACIVELQDHEATVEADRLPGTEIAETHLAYLLEQCGQNRGQIFIALNESDVLGFVCMWTEEEFGLHFAHPATSAYVSDLVVRAEHRKGGVGRKLMTAAEQFAAANGAELLAVRVLAGNQQARAFYAQAGYREYELLVTKTLG